MKQLVKLSRGEKFFEARRIHNRHGDQTLAEVYAATGVSASMIADLENDDVKRGVNYQTIVKLAQYYGVCLDYLIGDSDDPRPEPGQKEAAAYLGLTDFETRNLAKWSGDSQFKLRYFKMLLHQRFLYHILARMESTAASISKLSASLTDENAAVTQHEARHIQRDLGEDLAKLLSPITGYSSLRTETDRILDEKEQENRERDYIADIEEYTLQKEAQHGKYPED